MSVSACTANLSSTAVVMLRAWSGLLRRGAVRSDPQAEDITTLRRWPSSTGRWPDRQPQIVRILLAHIGRRSYNDAGVNI